VKKTEVPVDAECRSAAWAADRRMQVALKLTGVVKI
jgi:hypothetical protein